MNNRRNTLNWLQLVRIPALFTAWSNILAAHILVTGGNVRYRELILLIAASSALYCAGMVLNDCFDFEEDRGSRAGRPLPSGSIDLRTAWLFGWGLLAGGVLLAAMVGNLQFWIALAISLCIILYDGVLKHTLAGAPAMGACRYLNWLLGLSVGGLSLQMLLLPLPVFLYITALTYLGSVETSARSRTALAACAAGMLLSAASIVVLNRTGALPHSWALALLGTGLLVVLLRLGATARNFTTGMIQRSMKLLILGIIPLDAILVFAGGPWWGGLLVLSLLLPGLALARILYVT